MGFLQQMDYGIEAKAIAYLETQIAARRKRVRHSWQRTPSLEAKVVELYELIAEEEKSQLKKAGKRRMMQEMEHEGVKRRKTKGSVHRPGIPKIVKVDDRIVSMDFQRDWMAFMDALGTSL